MKRIEAAILIAAKPDQVWGHLTDFAAYPDWNPFVQRIEGSLDVGKRLTVRIVPPGGQGSTFRPRILIVIPGRQLRWVGSLRVPGLFRGEHWFRIEPADGGSRFVQGEVFSGLLVPIMGGILDKTLAGFETMNAALKERAEKQ